jgi:diacylglycerol O-acyltransferase
MVGIWPMGPITDGAGLNITVMSYLGNVNFGLLACREIAPDLASLARHIDAATAELLAAAGATPTVAEAVATGRRQARKAAID